MNSVSGNKTYLFFPIEIGLAHICRSLAVAEELVARGHTVYFALPKRKWHVFAKTTVNVVPIEGYVYADDFGMNVKLFRDQSLMHSVVQQELTLIDKYKPDAIVVDFRISAFVAATMRDIPTFAIFVGDGLPYGACLPNPGLPRWAYLLLRNTFPSVYDLASRWYLGPFIRYLRTYGFSLTFDAWMRDVIYIVPEAPFYMPPASRSLAIYHTGTLGWYAFAHPKPEWLHALKRDRRTVYVSFGGTGFDKQKPIEISTALVKQGYRVIVSTGLISDPSAYPKDPNLLVTNFLPGNEICKYVDLVVCHGGYGTMMDAIQQEVPVLAIPFNPDQILHAARMQELGVARSLMHITLLDMWHIFSFQWGYIEEKNKRLSVNTIISEIDTMFQQLDVYKKNIQEFNVQYHSTNGPSEAADIVERFS